MNQRTLAGISGAALVAGFFLPWLSADGMFKASAFDILRATHRFGDPSMALALVPVAGLILLALAASGSKNTKTASVLTGAGILGYGAYKALMAFFAVTGWGLWLVGLAAVVAMVSPLFAKRDR